MHKQCFFKLIKPKIKFRLLHIQYKNTVKAKFIVKLHLMMIL